jgi:predicted RNase H-like nuclease (RuvC/YqgF family)
LRGTAEEKYIYDENLGKLTAQIILEKLNQSDNLKKLALLDKAVLEHKYTELFLQYNKLNEQKEALEEEVNTLKSQIEYANIRIEGPVEQFRLIQQKNKEISDLKEALQALCSKLDESNISANECN